MEKIILLILASSLSGCAFYQKDYISKVYLDGKSYPGGDRYRSSLKCGDIHEGTLHIKLNEKKVREYRVEFKEGAKREVRFHLMFVT